MEISQSEINNVLQNLYTNPSYPGSFSGLENIFHVLRKQGHKFKKHDVKNWIKGKDAYTLHHPRRNIYPRNKIIVAGIDDTWQIDLADMSNICKENDNYKFLLVCIDVFSKFVAIEPTKNKEAGSVCKAMLNIFERTKRKPKQIQSDDFIKLFQKFFKQQNIRYYSTRSEMKACIVERFFRSSHRYIDNLQNFVDAYNNSYQ